MEQLKKKLTTFTKERNWDQYHNPKNLLLSLVSEIGELAEIFRWYSQEECLLAMENPKVATRVREEIADVFNNLLLLSMKLDIDLVEVAHEKIHLNAKKYPLSDDKKNILIQLE